MYNIYLFTITYIYIYNIVMNYCFSKLGNIALDFYQIWV